MATGFVYILLNPAFPDYVKIGLTLKSAEERARELRTTGVPAAFIVIYDELVSDCRAVERKVHQRFHGYRVENDREFFRVPVKEAIRVLREEAAAYQLSTGKLLRRIEILPALREMYRAFLKPDIISVAIVQPPGVCFLEVVRRANGTAESEIVETEDLEIFAGPYADDRLFPPDAPVEENASRFLELDGYSLIMTGMPLFTDRGDAAIAEQWERSRLRREP